MSKAQEDLKKPFQYPKGYKKPKKNKPINEFFNKKTTPVITTPQSQSVDAPIQAVVVASSPVTTNTSGLPPTSTPTETKESEEDAIKKKEEEEKKRIQDELDDIIIELPHFKVTDISNLEHFNWCQTYINSTNHTGKWVVTEKCIGKDLIVYSNGRKQGLSTPYHGVIDTYLSPFHSVMDEINALLIKIQSMDDKVKTIGGHFVVYGSQVDPGSPYTNSDMRSSLIDVYLFYLKPINPDDKDEKGVIKPIDPRDIKNWYYKTLTYSVLERWLESKGVFTSSKGDKYKYLSFKAPKILKTYATFAEACTYDLVKQPLTSEFDKSVRATAVVIKSDTSFFVTPTKTKNKLVRVIAKKTVPIHQYADPTDPKGKRMIKDYPDFTQQDLVYRLAGKLRVSKTKQEQDIEDEEKTKKEEEEKKENEIKKELAVVDKQVLEAVSGANSELYDHEDSTSMSPMVEQQEVWNREHQNPVVASNELEKQQTQDQGTDQDVDRQTVDQYVDSLEAPLSL